MIRNEKTTEEMHKVWEKVKPYIVGKNVLREDTPKEIRDLYQKVIEYYDDDGCVMYSEDGNIQNN